MLKGLARPSMTKLKNLFVFNYRFILLTIFILLYVFFNTKIRQYHSKYLDTDTTITGQIKDYTINGDKLTLEVKGREKITANYYFKTAAEKEKTLAQICLGCTITFTGKNQVVLNNTIPHTFNYKNYLANQKIYRSYNITNFKIKTDNNFFYQIKTYLYKRSAKLKNSDYLKIFILGDKSLIKSEEYSLFQQNGVAHLLAISGMHIGVLLKVLDLFFKKTKLVKKTIIISSILLFYGFLTNFAASLMRAAVFYIILNCQKIFHWRLSNFKLLLITAYILLLWQPFYFYDVGFIYSFVITGGIILNNKYLKGNYLKQLLVISLISFGFSLPITINLNYEINLTSILANLFFVPYISLLVYPLALLTFLFPLLSPIFNFSLLILNLLNSIFGHLALMVIIPRLNLFFIVLYYLLLFWVLAKPRKWGILVLFLIMIKFLPKCQNNYQIYYLDVGQGDSAVIITPWQKDVLLIDTGGKVEIVKESWAKSSKTYFLSDNTLKFLKSLGISHLDYLITTHGDNDHLGEVQHIIETFKVKKVIFNLDSYNSLEQKIIQSLKKKKIAYQKGLTKLELTNLTLDFLNTGMYDDENNDSNVIYFKIANYQFLFMGDAGQKREADLIKNYALANITFLKVGHHGSNTSSSRAFINQIQPKYAIISVGRNNSYGHPHEEVLVNLQSSQIFRTDRDGTIAIKICQNNYQITKTGI